MPTLSVWMIRAALLHLGTGFTLGALLLWNKGLPFEGTIWRLLIPHIEFVLLGWTLQLAMGAAYWIMPRFSDRPRYGNARLARAAFVLINAGVGLVVLGSFVVGDPLIALGRLCELLAAGAFALHLWPRVKPLGGHAAGQNASKRS